MIDRFTGDEKPVIEGSDGEPDELARVGARWQLAAADCAFGDGCGQLVPCTRVRWAGR
jgi:hypothetical protein